MLWQKDGPGPEDWVSRFTVGEDPRWDTLLLPYDIEGTRAHAWGLSQIGVLTEDELEAIEKSLAALEAKTAAGEVAITVADEDCHTLIEKHLTDGLGDLGKKIHAGRSRNDQVLVALRLFLREGLDSISEKAAELAERLCTLGEEYDDALMPGYTHLQRAMPSTAGLWVLGFAELLASDLEALRDAHWQVNVSPLGSAAGYGVPHLRLPRKAMAERLGFRAVQTHVTAVQLSRGKIELHAVHALVQLAATINRLASDLVLFNTAEFDFVELPDAYCTGSSIMPQKKNPDVLELARAAYPRLLSEVQLLLSLPANLPSGYHRDLQHTKGAAMRSVLQVRDLLTAMSNVLSGLRFNRKAMQEACTPELFATAHALEAVERGVPFRKAYRQATQDPEAWQQPEAPLAAYQVDGFPGRGRPDLVRERIARVRMSAEGSDK